MANNLKIFGVTYPNAKGIKAKDTNDNMLTFGIPQMQTKSATPTETAQTITPDSGYDGLSQVSVGAISSNYVGTGITRRSSADLTASGTTVTVPSGYYAEQASKSVSIKNVQAYMGYATVNSTSYVDTTVTITVAKTGTYNVSWMGYRNRNSGTHGSQLYKNGTAVGSASTTYLNTYGQYVNLTNQTFAEGDVLVVRARSSSTTYYTGVGNLIIEEV